MAPRTTINPLTTTKIAGMRMKGLYGLCKSGSRYRKTIAPRTVRKKNEYSPKPLNVRRARKFPKRIYRVESIVERSRALRGASDLEVSGGSADPGFELDVVPSLPTTAKNRGSQFVFPAATVMRPVTKEFPRSAPATTRQTRIAATIPKPCPNNRVMAVCHFQRQLDDLDPVRCGTYHGHAVCCRNQVPRKKYVVSCICGNKANDDCWNGCINSEWELTGRRLELGRYVNCLDNMSHFLFQCGGNSPCPILNMPIKLHIAL